MALIDEHPGLTKVAPRKIKRYGWRPDLPDPRDRIFNLEERISLGSALPAKADLGAHMPPIYDQGQLGSCTANGIAACLEYDAIRQGEAPVTPSRLFIYYNERVIEGDVSTDAGAQIRDGIKVVATEGAPPESEWPYSDANPGPFSAQAAGQRLHGCDQARGPGLQAHRPRRPRRADPQRRGGRLSGRIRVQRAGRLRGRQLGSDP